MPPINALRTALALARDAVGVTARSGGKAIFGSAGDGSDEIKWDFAPGHQVKRL